MVEVSLTVGKLDASIAVLLTADHHLIEFPSILLPSAIQAGSIVKINCLQDLDAEKKEQEEFNDLQNKIYELYGKRSPIRPQLRVRNATQTSIVLEWDPLDLATADLRSLSLFRNNTRLGRIPSPMTNTSTKLSGLSIDTAYTFHLELATSAGVYVSDRVTVKTHKMTDLSGITVCVGVVSDEDHAILEETVARIGAKPLQDRIRIDTTHFICVEPRGPQWERAVETNIPVVRPEWLRACESEGRIVGVRNYYLNADPKLQPPIRQNPGPRSANASTSSKLAASPQSQRSRSPAAASPTARPVSPARAARSVSPARGVSPIRAASPVPTPAPVPVPAPSQEPAHAAPVLKNIVPPVAPVVVTIEEPTPIDSKPAEIPEPVKDTTVEEADTEVPPQAESDDASEKNEADVEPSPTESAQEVVEEPSGDIGGAYVEQDGVDEVKADVPASPGFTATTANSSTDKFEDAATVADESVSADGDEGFESVPL